MGQFKAICNDLRRETQDNLKKTQDILNGNQNSYRHLEKLDGVGPVDNRPSTDKLHHFVQKEEEKKKKKVKCDM